jgi:hypothetical protein
MIFLIHQKAGKLIEVLRNNNPIPVSSKTCTGVIWELAENYPNEIIGWCEESFWEDVALENWKEIFHHDLIMASYSIETTFLSHSIGYVDQLPFININREVKYPTWQMSSDIGGIKGQVLCEFKSLCGNISGFDYLLNAIGKIGQQNGLFCYNEPALTNAVTTDRPAASAISKELFSFVHQHYTNSWTSVLLWCFYKYEKKFFLLDYLKAFFKEKKFRTEVDLLAFKPKASEKGINHSIDVIIPTLGRKKYLEQVLEDLENQSLLPENVIIIEQDPDKDSQTHISDLISKDWSYKIIHHFTHKTGACNARNLALDEVRSEWIFFADDDIRFRPDLLENVMQEASRYQVSAINLNCKQPGEVTIFGKVKQWGSFGAGTSVLKSSFARECRFAETFEFGFGEDADFGMQLRNKGCDIMYHPQLQTLHLKASIGGFRKKPVLPWEQGELLPKPSPTLMAYAIKHYTIQQIKGYKVSLFLKFYRRQEIKNPVKYFRIMKKRWNVSEKWAVKLLNKKNPKSSS